MKATSVLTRMVWHNGTRGRDAIREQHIGVAWCDKVIFGIFNLGQAAQLPPLR
jgi:hypothetical protein